MSLPGLFRCLQTIIAPAAVAWLAAFAFAGCLDDGISATEPNTIVSDTLVSDVAADSEAPDVIADVVTSPDAVVATDAVVTEGPLVTGTLYDDFRDLARSAWLHAPPAARTALAERTVTLFSPPPAAARTTTTDASGRFTFANVAPGPHLVFVDTEPGWRCNSNNLARRVPAAIREGALTIVTFGDSVPHWGPEPWFPARLKTHLDPFAAITDINIAVPGSTSPEWLPGGFHFPTLQRHLADADLVTFSLGGNDLGAFLQDFIDVPPEELLADLATYLALFDAEIDRVENNLKTIIAAIREGNPTTDIIWFVYPNYAWNDHWSPYLGDWADIVRTMLGDRLDDVRTRMSRVDDLLLADMYGGVAGEDVAGLMIDELHLNAAGHARYASEIFTLLGGVEIGADAMTSVGLDRSYGFAVTPVTP